MGKRQQLFLEAGGALSIEKWMEVSLYHPRGGYYARNIRTVGAKGDFSTASTLHPALGQALACWALEHQHLAMSGGRWHLIEVGGGGGQLASSILEALPWPYRRSLLYHIVETSPVLRQAQEACLNDSKGNRPLWHDSLGEALSQTGGVGLVFSNELVDAFPCVQLCYKDAQWTEVTLVLEDGVVVESFSTELDPRLKTIPCSVLDLEEVPEGQRCEVHLSYYTWLEQWLPHLRSGALLTIDYGDTLPGLYYRRRGGSLRGYFQHLRLEGEEVYQAPGRIDLTADVNFTDLRRWGESFGLVHECQQSQREFLARYTADLEGRERSDPALAFVANPRGMGGAYQVLVQRKDP